MEIITPSPVFCLHVSALASIIKSQLHAPDNYPNAMITEVRLIQREGNDLKHWKVVWI